LLSNLQMTPSIADETWRKVEIDYRLGVKSLRQVADEYGLTEGAIRKRAKRDEWARDLNARVRAKADALVRKELVRIEQVRCAGTHITPTEERTIDIEGAVQARIRSTHRTYIEHSRVTLGRLMAELEESQDELRVRIGCLKQIGRHAQDLVTLRPTPGAFANVPEIPDNRLCMNRSTQPGGSLSFWPGLIIFCEMKRQTKRRARTNPGVNNGGERTQPRIWHSDRKWHRQDGEPKKPLPRGQPDISAAAASPTLDGARARLMDLLKNRWQP